MVEPSRVFIAYAREDESRVRELYRKLRDRGFAPWLDVIDIMGGQIWGTEIPKAIHQAAVFLACLSGSSVEKCGYVQNEFHLALLTYAQMPHGSIWLIPVRLDDCEVPESEILKPRLRLKDFQWVDLWKEDGFDRLAAAIEHKVGKRTHREPGTLRDVDAPWCPELVVLPPGKLLMGSPKDEIGRCADEEPQHKVKIEYSLAVGRYPVTFVEWDAWTAAGGIEGPCPRDWNWGRRRRPVIDVSWNLAQTYVSWLSAQTGNPYRLLSEAEWEYACRAGTRTRYSYGDEITEDEANFGRKHGKTTEVGMYPANAFGLHDMHGNVFEWVLDEWHDDYAVAPSDGRAHTTGRKPSRRMLRGGSWYDMPRLLRSAARYWRSPSAATDKLGFRVCREV